MVERHGKRQQRETQEEKDGSQAVHEMRLQWDKTEDIADDDDFQLAQALSISATEAATSASASTFQIEPLTEIERVIG
ncbi:hypothetical protein BGZ54_005438 [Gamsiella multidivaricata]|nr:hypothetical protein BGZ54_005438 [Gamsiella multidivaricata]